MAFDYIEARQAAKELIEEFGGPGAFVVPGAKGGFDPESGDTLADQPDKVISGTITPLLDYDAREVDDSSIQTGDTYAFFHSDEAPPIGAITTVNGVKWRVVSAVSLDSVGGINVFRKIQLRR